MTEFQCTPCQKTFEANAKVWATCPQCGGKADQVFPEEAT